MILVEGISHINIPTFDLEKSKSFYSDILDFEVIENKGDEFILMGRDILNIKLVKIPSDFQFVFTELKLPILSFIMDMDDFTEAIGEIEDEKIDVFKGPEMSSSGEFLQFFDPSKNLIEIYYKNSDKK